MEESKEELRSLLMKVKEESEKAGLKAEHPRIDAFELWSWRRLLSSLDCKEIKPVNPKESQS